VVTAGPSILSLTAAGLYAVVLCVCVVAAITARRYRQPFGHIRTWALIALFFGALALMRIENTEELLRDMLRAEFREDGDYDGRRALQLPLVVALMAMFAGLFLWGLWRQWRAAYGKRNMALFVALAAVGAMMFLISLRIVSLHQTDHVLYGPPKLNWILDIGSSLTVLATAVFYTRRVTRRR
jgi:hypothetical protein